MTYKDDTVSFWDWFIVMLILMIPVINFIMLFVWAFGGGVNESKANFARASLAIGGIFAIFVLKLLLNN